MDATTELRWFWSDPRDPLGEAAAAAIMEALRLADQKPQERTDRYLLFPKVYLGVKLREGRFEIKCRQSATTDVEAAGVVEQWLKWSHHDEEHPAGVARFAESGPWLALQKWRRLLVFATQSSGDLALIAPDAPAEEGCQVEFTELSLSSGAQTLRGWTLGYEAFGGASERQHTALAFALRRTHAASALAPCSVAHSMGYPEWLLRMAAGWDGQA